MDEHFAEQNAEAWTVVCQPRPCVCDPLEHLFGFFPGLRLNNALAESDLPGFWFGRSALSLFLG